VTGTVLSRIVHISIAKIETPNGGRDLEDDRVTDLVASMQRIGMLNPIGIRIVDGNPRLVYGRHRLAAAQSIGWVNIECHVLEGDDRRARMAEIAENLHRVELSELERSEQITEWIKLAAEEAEDKPAQVAQVSPATGGRGQKGGLSEAAREIGLTREAARRAQTIAGLPAEAKAAAQDLRLADNQSALLEAAKSPDPLGALKGRAKRPRQSPRKIAQHQAAKTLVQEDEADRPLRRLFRAWLFVTQDEKLKFIRSTWEMDRGPWKDWVTETVHALIEPAREPSYSSAAAPPGGDEGLEVRHGR
jgi:ParB family transcriptional regulator, chromosome partitioning protein